MRTGSGRKRKWWSISLILIVIILVAIYLLHRGQTPVTTQITSPSVPGPSSNSSNTGTQAVTTDYFSTVLPSGWHVSQTNSAQRVSVLGVGPGSSNEQAAIVSDILPSNGVQGVADYNLRATETSTYTRLSSSGLPAGSVTFQSTSDGVNDTLFMVEAGRYASLSATAGDPASALSLLKTMTGQWLWR